MPLTPRLTALLSRVCLAAYTGLVMVGARHHAGPLAESMEASKLAFGATLLLLSLGVGVLLALLPTTSDAWLRATLSGAVGLVAAAAAYSCVRHEAVLVPLPALFCPAGSALGATSVMVLRGWKSRRSATSTCRSRPARDPGCGA